MTKAFRIFTLLSSVVLCVIALTLVSTVSLGEIVEPRGEIRVVENVRPDVTVVGNNVLQYLFEYATDKNELSPSLGVSREWIDETTLKVKLRQGVRFHNGEPFDAHAVKFNLDYQLKVVDILDINSKYTATSGDETISEGIGNLPCGNNKR